MPFVPDKPTTQKGRFVPDAASAPEVPSPNLAERASKFVSGFFRKAGSPSTVLPAAVAPISTPLKAGGRIIRDNPEGAIEAIPSAAVGIASLPLMATGVGAIPAMAGLSLVGAAGEHARQGMRESSGLPPTVPGRHPFVEKLLGGENGPLSYLPEKAKADVLEGAVSGLPEILGPIISVGARSGLRTGGRMVDAAKGLAKRSLGIQKSQLYASKSWGETMRKIAQTDRAAEEALKRGDLPYLGGAEEMANRSLKLLKEGADKVDTAMSAANKSGFRADAPSFAKGIIAKMNPRLPAEMAVAEKVVKDIEAFSDVAGVITPDDLNKLRQYWGKVGFRDKTVSSVDADLYKDAWRHAGDSLRDLLEEVSPETAATYREGLRQEEMANVALGGITNRMAAEEGNAAVSIPGLGTKIQKRVFAPIARAAYRTGKVVEGSSASAERVSPVFPSIFRAATSKKEKRK